MANSIEQIELLKEINKKTSFLLKQFNENHDENAFITAKLQRLLERKRKIIDELDPEPIELSC